MSRFLKLYQNLLNKYPYYFQAVQTGFLMGTGDIIAQSLVERKTWKDFSFYRTMSFVTVGTFMVGPVLTRWYVFLHNNFSAGKYAVFKKVAVDQTCMAPCLIASIISSLGLLAGQSLEELKHQFKSDYKDILLTNYKLWPFVQLFNFYMIPLNYQVMVVQLVAIMWNTYLSWKIDSYKKQGKEVMGKID